MTSAGSHAMKNTTSMPIRLLRALAFAIILSAGGGILGAQEFTNINFVVSKTQTFYQTNTAPPQADCEAPFCFFSSAQADEAFVSLTKVTVTAPNGEHIALNPANVDIGGGVIVTNVYRTLDCATDRGQIDEEYPSGDYEAKLDYDFLGLLPGSFQIGIPLSRDLYPNTPTFKNAQSAQQIPANQDYRIEWEPFVGASDLDSAGLLIFECTNAVSECENCAGKPVFRSADFYLATNAAPSVVIPAGTLRVGVTYEAQLVFDHWNAFRLTNYVELELFDITMLARSSYTKVTRMPVRVVVDDRPQLTVLSSLGRPNVRFRYDTKPGRTYRVHASANLAQWAVIATTNAAATSTIYEEPRTNSHRFYRVETSL